MEVHNVNNGRYSTGGLSTQSSPMPIKFLGIIYSIMNMTAFFDFSQQHT